MDVAEQLNRLPTADIDPVDYGMTAEGVVALCNEHLSRAAALRRRVSELPEDAPLTWDNVLEPLDALGLETAMAAGFAELMSETHPEDAVREAARSCRPKVTTFYTDLLLDADLARVVRRYAASGPALEPVRQRFLDELLRDFRRNGLELAPTNQARLRELNERLSSRAQDFARNIAESEASIEVPLDRLGGLPETFLAGHRPGTDGMIRLSTATPDYFPVMSYCDDRDVARELFELYDQRAAEKNVPILEEVLELRREKARLLGYESWAHFSIEPKMAETPENVRSFLDRAIEAVREPARREFQEFLEEYRRLGLSRALDQVAVQDRLYVQNLLGARKYGFDGKRLSEYFEVGRVVSGALELVRSLFGVDLRDNDNARRWHADVRAYDVVDEGRVLGRLYLDLYPRPNKFQHAAMFEVRPGRQLADRYLGPITALVCNFQRPGGGADAPPALLAHEDVITFFHELGHALHHLLTRQPLVSFSGTNTAHDFVEVPSQVFEEWAYRRETLDLFARHHRTGEPIPTELFEAMTRARAFGRALAVERQLAFASLDYEYHVRPPPLDTSAVLKEVMAQRQSFTIPDDSRFQAAFGHLMGYDAGYYGYQWALAIARDVLTRFEREGFLNGTVAQEYRRAILEQGAGPHEAQLVRDFLGRDTDLEAYGAYLKGAS